MLLTYISKNRLELNSKKRPDLKGITTNPIVVTNLIFYRIEFKEKT